MWASLAQVARAKGCFYSLLLVAFSIALCGCRDTNGQGSVITFITDPGANSYNVTADLVREFEAETGHRVRLIRGPADATERLSQYLQYLGAESGDVDIYQLDVIWPASLENHLVDLSQAFSTTETAAFFPALIENNSVDERLLAIPYYVDLPLLYYREDLLQKHGFTNPPATWDELTTIAETILERERAAGAADLWGYVWQGRAYEGLTCNALEWQMAEGGGSILSPGGEIQVNTSAAIRAFDRAASWIGTISPPGITMYAEEEARQMFQSGNAVFMRNWPYAYSLLNSDQSTVNGKTGTAPLPRGQSGSNASTLGGWQLAVSRYSPRQEAAIELVRFLTGEYAQKQQALRSSRLPTRTSLYDDPDVAAKFPFIPTMRGAMDTAVARPSAQAGMDYNEVSTYYFQHVHQVLTGQHTAAESMRELHTLLETVLK